MVSLLHYISKQCFLPKASSWFEFHNFSAEIFISSQSVDFCLYGLHVLKRKEPNQQELPAPTQSHNCFNVTKTFLRLLGLSLLWWQWHHQIVLFTGKC